MFAQTFQMGPLFVKVLISTCSTLQFRFGTSVCFKPLGLKIGSHVSGMKRGGNVERCC